MKSVPKQLREFGDERVVGNPDSVLPDGTLSNVLLPAFELAYITCTKPVPSVTHVSPCTEDRIDSSVQGIDNRT